MTRECLNPNAEALSGPGLQTRGSAGASPHRPDMEAALVLIGHGSTLNAESAAPVYQQADELRRRRVFAAVHEAFWKQEPYVWQVLRGVFARQVFLVPFFISDGYFTEEVLPRELGMSEPVQERATQTLYYCGPVGSHPAMTEVLLARARNVVEQFPFPCPPPPSETALFIAGHGTGKNENSRKAIERQVELIRERRVFAEVYPAFMEEEPRIGDCYKIAKARDIVMVPFFISDGLHTQVDIPVMLGATEAGWRNPTEHEGKRLWYARSVGSEPLMADVILERVREAYGRKPQP